jgi:hypothetical protein
MHYHMPEEFSRGWENISGASVASERQEKLLRVSADQHYLLRLPHQKFRGTKRITTPLEVGESMDGGRRWKPVPLQRCTMTGTSGSSRIGLIPQRLSASVDHGSTLTFPPLSRGSRTALMPDTDHSWSRSTPTPGATLMRFRRHCH